MKTKKTTKRKLQ